MPISAFVFLEIVSVLSLNQHFSSVFSVVAEKISTVLEELSRRREQIFYWQESCWAKRKDCYFSIEGKIKNHFLARHYLEIVIAKAITEDERHTTPVEIKREHLKRNNVKAKGKGSVTET